MKYAKTIIVALMSCIAATCYAQWTQNGYYRVLNQSTERYITIIDNTAKVSTVSTSVDMGALQTLKKFDNVVSNPASIIYIRYETSPNQFSLASQGTDTRKITGQYLSIVKSRTNSNAYWAYGSSNGMTIYLSDTKSFRETSEVGSNSGPNDLERNWYIQPVKKDVDKQYFGITPEVEYNGKYYATLYAFFPFNLGDGMKAYSIIDSNNQAAVYKEITGTIPIGTPVLIECSSPTADGNRIDIVNDDVAALSGNKLVGQWFCSHKDGHINRKEYSASTMRVLGLKKDGKLGFIKAPSTYLSQDNGKYYLPANKAYLPVLSNSADELTLMTEDEFSGINTISKEETHNSGVYTLTGTLIRKRDESSDNLAKGIYIINGKKVIVQ